LGDSRLAQSAPHRPAIAAAPATGRAVFQSIRPRRAKALVEEMALIAPCSLLVPRA
jgi:hypothetical protein